MKFESYVKDLFSDFEKQDSRRVKVLCPVHSESNPSCSINLENGRWNCFTCGEKGHLDDLADRLQWPKPPDYDKRKRPTKKSGTEGFEFTCEWVYNTPEGAPYLKVERWDRNPPVTDKRNKTYPQACWRGGQWVKVGMQKTPLFHADRIVQKLDQPIYLVEGEKAATWGASAGLLTTTSPEGAGKFSKVDPAYLELLRGRDLIILPDNDEQGLSHARDVAKRAAPFVKSVKILQLPNLPAKGDLADWLQGTNTTGKLAMLAQACPELELRLLQLRRPHQYHRSDLGQAELLIDMFGADLRYCHTATAWWWWDAMRWTQDTTGRALHLANLSARARQEAASEVPDEETREKEVKWAFGAESRSKRDATLAQAISIPGVSLRYEEMDLNPWILCCQNGTLDLKTGVLREHRREDLCTQLVPVAYDPQALCPTWDSFLLKIMGGSQSMVDFLRRAIGYSLSGSTREQILFILWGQGRNGKSVFLETILRLLGSYSQATSPATFMVSQSETVRNDLARLRGARFVKAVETSDGKRLDEGLIKQVTGCDRMPVRFLFQEYFEFDPQLKLWLATNHRPEIRGQDLGIWRRIRLIPFLVVITEEEDNKDLQAALLDELPGILAWAVRGCLEWQGTGLREPEEVLVATKEYRNEQDSLGKFFDECCLLDPVKRALNAELYNAYREWTKRTGEWCLSQTKFSTLLKSRGYQQNRTNSYREWVGIGLLVSKPISSDEEPSEESPSPAPPRPGFTQGCDEWGLPIGELF